MAQTVLILGGRGKIGSRATECFAAAGWQVRQFDRKTQDMTEAAMGADIIVNGLNPPAYHDWENLIPAITSQVIAAAKASGATVIIPGNVYNFAAQAGVFDENTPQTATTKKGQIRIAMEDSYRRAGVRTIILRAGNFIDPAGNGDIMEMMIMRDIKKGRLTAAAHPDTMQAYAFVPDWARAAVMLAEKRAALAPFEDVPFAGHSFTINQMRDVIRACTGRDYRIARFPWVLMTLLAPFWELARELREMRYLSELNHQISGEKLARLLPDFTPTDLETVICAGLPADVHPNKPVRPSGGTILANQ